MSATATLFNGLHRQCNVVEGSKTVSAKKPAQLFSVINRPAIVKQTTEIAQLSTRHNCFISDMS